VDVRACPAARFCAGVDRGSRSSSVRSFYVVRRSTSRTRSCTNTFVVADLPRQGAVFVDELDQVPPVHGDLSAHGVAKSVQEEAAARGFAHLRCNLARW